MEIAKLIFMVWGGLSRDKSGKVGKGQIGKGFCLLQESLGLYRVGSQSYWRALIREVNAVIFNFLETPVQEPCGGSVGMVSDWRQGLRMADCHVIRQREPEPRQEQQDGKEKRHLSEMKEPNLQNWVTGWREAESEMLSLQLGCPSEWRWCRSWRPKNAEGSTKRWQGNPVRSWGAQGGQAVDSIVSVKILTEES